MNSRVKTLFGLIVLVLGGLLCAPHLTRADELGWERLKTEKIEVQAFGSDEGEVISSYPPLLQKLFRDVISWDPRNQSPHSEAPSAHAPCKRWRAFEKFEREV